MPRFLLRILFGKPQKPSRSYAALRDTYRGVLNKGGGAGGFAPEPSPSLGSTDADRAKLMATREALANQLADAVGRWREEDLDRYRLPHPLLGKLTVREMLWFTAYHNYHHPRSLATRLTGAA